MTSMHGDRVIVGVGPLYPEDVVRVARGGWGVRLADEALAEIARSRDGVYRLAKDGRPHYGVSPGFGALATRHIPLEQRAQLQRSLIRSHAAGAGPEVEREVVRALMLLRLSTLATGRTGVRVETAQAYAAMLDAGLTPLVHEYGSLGGSGEPGRRSPLPPGPHWPPSPGRSWARARSATAPGRCDLPRTPSGNTASDRSSWPRRKGSRWSTAPTACSACWCWPSPTSGGC